MSSNRIITFNVGGTKFQTLASTVQRAPDSLLAKLVNQLTSGDHGENCSVHTDDSGAIFIDRSPKFFSMILDFLRSDKSVRSCTSLPSQDSPDAAVERHALMREMCDHYSMPDCAVLIAPRTFLFDPAHASPGLDISANGQTATVKQGQINQWNSVRCAIPLLTDSAMFSSGANPMLLQKMNRFTVCIDRDINVMIGVQDPPILGTGVAGSNAALKSASSGNLLAAAAKEKGGRRMSVNPSSSQLGRKASQSKISKGTVLQFTSGEHMKYQPCKLQLGVVSGVYQCAPINRPLIPEGRQHETLQPIKTPHVYACPVNGSLKASETFSVWFDAQTKELIFYRGDTVLYKYMNAENIAGKMQWYFCVSFQSIQPGRFVSVVPNH